MTLITPEDLAVFAPELPRPRAEAMIADAVAQAVRVAPCLAGDLPTADAAYVKAILRTALLRWNDAGIGALTAHSVQAGSYAEGQTVDTRQGERRRLLWPSEVHDLQAVCANGAPDSATVAMCLLPPPPMTAAERFKRDLR